MYIQMHFSNCGSTAGRASNAHSSDSLCGVHPTSGDNSWVIIMKLKLSIRILVYVHGLYVHVKYIYNVHVHVRVHVCSEWHGKVHVSANS